MPRRELPTAPLRQIACGAVSAETDRRGAQQLWSAVDQYIGEQLLPADPVLQAALQSSNDAGLPRIAVTPTQGKLLEMLVRLQRARTILELGTLGGYSTIWLARGLPGDGRLITIEAEPSYAEVARANIARADLTDRVEQIVGPGLEVLPRLQSAGAGPFDLIFIDADKKNNPGYLQWSLKLSRPGTLIIADNVVRDGAILDPDAYDPALGDRGVQGVRRFFELLAAEPHVSATAIQTVGAKGYDGFALAVVEGAPDAA
jgi:predicted O-methyltransferase YrrM